MISTDSICVIINLPVLYSHNPHECIHTQISQL